MSAEGGDVDQDLDRSRARPGSSRRPAGFDTVAIHVAGDLAVVVEVEHFESKIGGGEDLSPVSLGVTTVRCLEDRKSVV